MASVFFIFTRAGIARTFFITAAMFGLASLYGCTTKSDLSKFGSFLVMCLVGVLVEAGSGTLLEADKGTPYGYITKTPAHILTIFAPGGYEHFFVDWDKEQPKPGPDLAKIEERYGVPGLSRGRPENAVLAAPPEF
jgi:Inhibitor of apoptosis-promoting Bax1